MGTQGFGIGPSFLPTGYVGGTDNAIFVCAPNSKRRNMKTRVVNLRKEPYDVYIGRVGKGQDGYFGNPFPLRNNNPEERERCVDAHEFWFYTELAANPEFRRRIEALKGKTLGCFCKPLECHGDVIVRYLEGKQT